MSCQRHSEVGAVIEAIIDDWASFDLSRNFDRDDYTLTLYSRHCPGVFCRAQLDSDLLAKQHGRIVLVATVQDALQELQEAEARLECERRDVPDERGDDKPVWEPSPATALLDETPWDDPAPITTQVLEYEYTAPPPPEPPRTLEDALAALPAGRLFSVEHEYDFAGAQSLAPIGYCVTHRASGVQVVVPDECYADCRGNVDILALRLLTLASAELLQAA